MKRILYHSQVELILGMQDWFNIQKSITIIHYVNRLERTNYMIILADAEQKNLTKGNINL